MSDIRVDMVELEEEVTEDDHILRPEDPAITLVEYADYQCPSCIASFQGVERLMRTHGDRVRLVFRHFPLMSHHPMAMPGAMAAEAAGRQGKFWEMHRRIFSAGGAFDEDDLTRWGEELGLDLKRYEADRHDEEIELHIREVRLKGAHTGVNGTPTFFLGGLRIEPDPTYESLAAHVDYFLEDANEE